MSSRSSSVPSSPARSVVALVPTSSNEEDPEWQPILHASNQVVLYNPRSHALTISKTSSSSSSLSNPRSPSSVVIRSTRKPRSCPYCKQTISPSLEQELFGTGLEHHVIDEDEDEGSGIGGDTDTDTETEFLESIYSDDPAYHSRAANYFQLLAISNETTSRPASPPHVLHENGYSTTTTSPSSSSQQQQQTSSSSSSAFPAENMAEGYFNRFFQEEYKLGMGANGSVFLCQHVLDGNTLGHFAVKKIAVGESHSYLLKILREVRLLEQLHHPNIVTYHHAWLETSQFSAFGPRIPTLHVLMQWAEGGSLDDFIDMRLGRKTAHPHVHFVPAEGVGRLDAQQRTPTNSPGPESMQSRSARIRAFRAFQHATPEERERMTKEGYGRPEGLDAAARRKGGGKEWTPVHLLSADEVKSLFHDVVEGLSFLHNKSILHLDLKPGNVLLTWDDGRMIPRAMLSDFGTSRDMVNSGRDQRSGNTGTLEYTSPESLPSPSTGLLGQIDSKSDMWSLGMILHKMLFFKLPYRYAAEGDANGEETSLGLGGGREEEKMQRLEREVLEYPGFKGNPGLVATFEARRLPRSFLVLLESLLHRTPSGRPSIDRVKTAIREGKFDPLRTPRGTRTQTTPTSPDALIPLDRVRTRSQSRSHSDPDVTTTTAAAIHAPLIHSESQQQQQQNQAQTKLLVLPSPPASPPFSLSSSSNSSLVVLPDGQDEDEAKGKGKGREIDNGGDGDDRADESGYLGSWRWLYRNMRGEVGERRAWWGAVGRVMESPRGKVGLRLVRSLVLVSKVLSTPRLCQGLEEYPRPIVLAILLGAAVADTVVTEVGFAGREKWYKGVLVSVGLAVFHVKVLEWGAGTGVCCARVGEGVGV